MRRFAVPLLLLVALVPKGGAAPPAPVLGACTLADGLQARCGTFVVGEDRAHPEGRSISLRLAVVPARDGGTKHDPLVYITGGPGGSAVADAPGLLSIFRGLNVSRDIVLVDQRGAGRSNRMDCPVPRTQLTTAARVRSYVKACITALSADPRLYTTVPAMDDLADVIGALGYTEVNIYGISYGATAAQYFLAQHPQLVRSAILDGATLLDVPIFERWAPNGERALQAVLARCAANRRCATAYPRVRREAFEIIAALRRKPVRAQGTLIDAATAAGALHALTLSPSEAAQLPWIAHRARVGDWIPLALTIDRVSVALSTRQVMFWSIVCNEPWARWNPARANAAARGTYLAERHSLDTALVSASCSVIPKVPQPAWSATRVHSDRPVLFVVGGADPQDPAANVANAVRELPNSRTVVVPGAGHGSVQLGCMPRLAEQFVERAGATGLDTACAARYAPPPFVIR